MTEDTPIPTEMTPEEHSVWSHLGLAYEAFVKLNQTHPSHLKDFADGLHMCQSIVGQRILQRLVPEHFAKYEKLQGTWKLVT